MMNCLIETDLSGAEWVITAYVCGDPNMIRVAESGKSPHPQTGELISGAPESFILFEEEHVGHITDTATIEQIRRRHLPETWEGVPVSDFFLPRSMSIRQCGKKANHGLNYREEYATFALSSGLSETEAKDVIFSYRGAADNTAEEDMVVAYPGLRHWYREIEETLRTDNRLLINCFGQTCPYLDKWGPRLFNQATAFIPQSTNANVTNKAMRTIYHYAHPDINLAANIHDSLLTHHTFSSFAQLSDQIHFVDSCFHIPITYRDRTFYLNRDVKLGLNWSEKAMISLPSVLGTAASVAALDHAYSTSFAINAGGTA